MEIPAELYEAVAEILAVVYRLKNNLAYSGGSYEVRRNITGGYRHLCSNAYNTTNLPCWIFLW